MIKIPRRAAFYDYSAFAFFGNSSRLAILSQEEAAVWVRAEVSSPALLPQLPRWALPRRRRHC